MVIFSNKGYKMLGTKQMLSNIADKDLIKLPYLELSEMYKKNCDAKVLASSFFKVFNLVYNLSGKYTSLLSSDIASWTLQSLDYALLNYSEGCEFTTLFGTVLKNKFKVQVKKENTQKRLAVVVELNEALEVGIEDVYDLVDLILPKNLTSNEKVYCSYAKLGYTNKMISEIMGVSLSYVYAIRDKLKFKICI